MDKKKHREETAKTNPVCDKNLIRCGTINKQDCTFAESRCIQKKNCASEQKVIRSDPK